MGNVADCQLLTNAVTSQHQSVDWHPSAEVVNLLLLHINLYLLV